MSTIGAWGEHPLPSPSACLPGPSLFSHHPQEALPDYTTSLFFQRLGSFREGQGGSRGRPEHQGGAGTVGSLGQALTTASRLRGLAQSPVPLCLCNCSFTVISSCLCVRPCGTRF